MSLPSEIIPVGLLATPAAAGGAAAAAYTIDRSLRFNPSDSAHLSRTPSSAGNRKTWTWSGWVKKSGNGAYQGLFTSTRSGNETLLMFDNSDRLHFYNYVSGAFAGRKITTAVFRDPSAWYHIACTWDSTNVTAADRCRLYVNGVRLTTFDTSTDPTSSEQTTLNDAYAHQIGNYADNPSYDLNGYLADVHLIDGQALDPTSFGEFNEYNNWQPKAHTGTYGPRYQGETWSTASAADSYAFDGSTAYNSSAVRLYGASTYHKIVDAATAFTNVTSVVVGTSENVGSIKLDGTIYSTTYTSGVGLTVISPPSSFSDIEVLGHATGLQIAYVRVNGEILIDSGVISGNNSFHLDFSDNSSNAALGTDTSGNGNDWTVNNISAIATANIDVTGFTASSGPGSGTNDAKGPFDGETTSSTLYAHGYGLHYITLNTSATPIPVQSSDTWTIYWSTSTTNPRNAQLKLTFSGGGSTTYTAFTRTSGVQSNTVTVGTTGSITEIDFRETSSSSPGELHLRGIAINGVLYNWNPGPDCDSLFDSPTNSGTDTGTGGEVSGNYATLNPIFSDLYGPAPTLSNGNLQLSQSSDRTTFGTLAVSSGKWYWEITITSGTSQLFGITDTAQVPVNNTTYNQAGSYYYLPSLSRKYVNGSYSSYGSTVSVGDVVGAALDLDNGEITFYKNGTSLGVMASSLPAATYVPGFGAGNTSAVTHTLNFGQRPFAYDITTTISQATGAIPILSTSDDYGQTLSSGTASDSNSSSLVLALPMNGTNGGTTFTDYSATIKGSGSAKTVTANGDAQTSTTESKWYGSSSAFDGTGDYLTVSDASASTVIGTGDFTVEFWLYATVGTSLRDAFGIYDGGSAGLIVGQNGTNIRFYCQGTTITSSSTIALNTWYHIAAVRTGTTGVLYVNGTNVGSATISSPTGTNFSIGRAGNYNGNYFSGYIQDFRVYKGAAKYTSNFTPPSSALFKALCTANLDEPTVPDGSTAMDVVTYTGNGSTQTISGLGFSPDLVWTKARSFAENNNVFDTVRGATKLLLPDSTNADQTISGITAFTSDGYTLGSHLSCNQNNSAYVSWNWDGGSSTVSNTDGSITSSVRANPTAGFSVATFTGASTGTIGHGLAVAPSMIIMKARTSNPGANDWFVYHKDVGNTKALLLNSSAAANTYTYWNNTSPTSTVFSIGSGIGTPDWVAYCWAPVEGYSAVGKWTGGSDAFVYLGFRPKWLLVKANASGYEWLIFDSERSTYNLVDDWLVANTAAAEVTSNATNNLDFLSNGFKIKGTGGYFGVSTDMLYIAFAEHPFRTSRAR